MVHVRMRLATAIGFAAFAVLIGAASTIRAQESTDRDVSALTRQPAVKAALAAARGSEPQTIDTQIRLTEIPAPSFLEAARAEEMKRLFQQAGLRNVRGDKAGNVLGDRPGAALHPHVVIAAHLDTVFPEGTNVKVRREGSVLHAPGIGDDSRGLAVLVAIARALNQADVRTPGSITFVADVGEEGLGDLRGIKTIFDDTLKGTVDRFVTIDGTGMGVAHTFVGSRRYRVTVKGPGGHSFADFGTPNPIGALGRAIAKIQEFQVPSDSQTTFNVGRIGGGTSVNSIPADAWMEVDLRSPDRAALAGLDAQLQKALDSALAAEHARWHQTRVLTMTNELVGDRPAGANAHAPNESFDTTDSWRGTERALLLTIALAQK
jgi:tripeptide aminopeptidase